MASSLFCRHNRFTADCQICSKGTVLDPEHSASRRSSGSSAPKVRAPGSARAKGAPAALARASYPRAEVGPYDDAEGARYSVRLERVPGGLRLAEWEAGAMRKRAPRLAPEDLARLVETAGEAGVLTAAEADSMRSALSAAGAPGPGASPGRSGDLREELRLEPLEDGALRVARWMERPGTGWEVREAPVMLPPARYVEALAQAGAAATASEVLHRTT